MGHALEWLFRRSYVSGLFGSIVISAFVLTQCLDGIFTYIGVSVWVISVEANPLIEWAMSTMGLGFGLTVAKLAAVGLGVSIYWRGFHNLTAMITVFYLVVVVIPWAYLFLTL